MTVDRLEEAARGRLVSPNQPGIFLSGRDCAILDRAGLGELRQRHRGISAELDSLLLGIHLAGQVYVDTREKAGSGSGTLVDDRSELPAQSKLCGASEAADRLKMTTRGVTKAAADGRLSGQKVDSRWLFTASDLETFATSRRAS